METFSYFCIDINSIYLPFLLDKPGTPRGLRVTDVWSDYISILWEAPESDGGSPLTGYTIEQRDAYDVGYKFVASVDPNTTTFQVGSSGKY